MADMAMVDGAELLRTIRASPGCLVLLPHDQAVAIAEALAGAQVAMRAQLAAVRQVRIGGVIGGMIHGTA